MTINTHSTPCQYLYPESMDNADASSLSLHTSSPLSTFGTTFGKLHGPLSLFVCGFGITTNLANIIVLTRPSMSNSATNHLLFWLAVADLLTMLIYMPCLYHFYIVRPNPMRDPTYTPYRAWAIYQTAAVSGVIIFHSLAIWITVILAVFRYLHVGFPLFGPRLATKQRATVTVIITGIFCLICVIPNALINHVDDCIGSSMDSLGNVNNQTDTLYYFVNHVIFENRTTVSLLDRFNSPVMHAINFWLQAILFKIIPSALLSSLTVLLIYELRQAMDRRKKLRQNGGGIQKRTLLNEDRTQQSHENRTTSLLLTILISFLIVEMPQGILVICLHLIEDFYTSVYRHLGDFIDFTTLVNESINFIIYTTMSRQFRETFCRVFYLTRIRQILSSPFERSDSRPSDCNG